MKLANAIGPFSPKYDIVQRVGEWPQAKYVVYLFCSKVPGTESFDRSEVEGEERSGSNNNVTLVVNSDYTVGRYVVASPWIRWTVFSLVAVLVLAAIGFFLYKIISANRE